MEPIVPFEKYSKSTLSYSNTPHTLMAPQYNIIIVMYFNDLKLFIYRITLYIKLKNYEVQSVMSKAFVSSKQSIWLESVVSEDS